ncbi:MAG: ATP-binding protein [Bacteroidota bacterium]
MISQEHFVENSEIMDLILIPIGLLLLMSIAIVLFFYFSRRRIIKAELDNANMEIAHQKELLRSTIITQEEERKRIAQDLHDAISSKLNVVSLNAHLLTDGAIPPEETKKIGGLIYGMTSNVLENSRRIAHDLLPATLEKFGLTAALEELCEELIETGKFQLEYELNYSEEFLSSSNELHVFRIVQELMNNSIKHSEATHVNLHLNTEENLLSLQYQDNGKGFDVDAAKKAKGLGMSGIENRTMILAGVLDVQSSPGKGLSVLLKTQAKHAN